MTRSRTDSVKARVFTLAAWWYRRGAWTQVMIAAGLLCVFELLVIWRLYPWLLGMVQA